MSNIDEKYYEHLKETQTGLNNIVLNNPKMSTSERLTALAINLDVVKESYNLEKRIEEKKNNDILEDVLDMISEKFKPSPFDALLDKTYLEGYNAAIKAVTKAIEKMKKE